MRPSEDEIPRWQQMAGLDERFETDPVMKAAIPAYRTMLERYGIPYTKPEQQKSAEATA